MKEPSMATSNPVEPRHGFPTWAPVPDPTLLTTQQLLRELASLEKVITIRVDGVEKAMEVFSSNLTRVPTDVDKQISALRAVSDERMKAISGHLDERWKAADRAVLLLQVVADRVPSVIEEKIGGLKEVIEEKFHSIEVQFRERDVRTEQSSKDSKVAVDAALQAAKEAVGKQNESSDRAILKSEAAVMKQIDALSEMIRSGAINVDSKFTDVKDRITRLEGKSEGVKVAETSHQTSAQFIITILAVIISFVSVSVAIFMAATRH